MNDKAKNAGVYLASANWDKVTAWIGAAVVGAYEFSPWLAGLIVPVLLHHGVQALFAGRQALAQAAEQAWMRERLASLAGGGEDFDRAEKQEAGE